tara:strand:+ start:23783 stop:24679 length:897 start_codon:yes stop_codon:yes gene_type:complete
MFSLTPTKFLRHAAPGLLFIATLAGCAANEEELPETCDRCDANRITGSLGGRALGPAEHFDVITCTFDDFLYDEIHCFGDDENVAQRGIELVVVDISFTSEATSGETTVVAEGELSFSKELGFDVQDITVPGEFDSVEIVTTVFFERAGEGFRSDEGLSTTPFRGTTDQLDNVTFTTTDKLAWVGLYSPERLPYFYQAIDTGEADGNLMYFYSVALEPDHLAGETALPDATPVLARFADDNATATLQVALQGHHFSNGQGWAASIEIDDQGAERFFVIDSYQETVHFQSLLDYMESKD